MENFDCKAIEALTPDQLKSGKPLLGKGRALALQKIITVALEKETDSHTE
jgi:hypothetical protein